MGNTFNVSLDDERYINGELVHISKNLVPVITHENKIISISREEYNLKAFPSMMKGFTYVKDKDDKVLKIDTSDERYINGELVHIHKGKLPVKDKDGNNYFVSVDDEKYRNGELVPVITGYKHSNEAKKKIGQANSIHQKGENNSQFGTCWIYNEELKVSKKIDKIELDNYINHGWLRGRKF